MFTAGNCALRHESRTNLDSDTKVLRILSLDACKTHSLCSVYDLRLCCRGEPSSMLPRLVGEFYSPSIPWFRLYLPRSICAWCLLAQYSDSWWMQTCEKDSMSGYLLLTLWKGLNEWILTIFNMWKNSMSEHLPHHQFGWMGGGGAEGTDQRTQWASTFTFYVSSCVAHSSWTCTTHSVLYPQKCVAQIFVTCKTCSISPHAFNYSSATNQKPNCCSSVKLLVYFFCLLWFVLLLLSCGMYDERSLSKRSIACTKSHRWHSPMMAPWCTPVVLTMISRCVRRAGFLRLPTVRAAHVWWRHLPNCSNPILCIGQAFSHCACGACMMATFA